jgi:hypothetical protein
VTTTVSPDDLFAIQPLLTDEKRQIRDTVRGLVQRDIRLHIDSWYSAVNCRCVTWPAGWGC